MSAELTLRELRVLTETDLWQTHGPDIWQADRFEGKPHFYPIYRWENYYSYSPLALAKLKGRVKLDTQSAKFLSRTGLPYCPPDLLIDTEIRRLGSAPEFDCQFIAKGEFLRHLTAAMNADVARVEQRHPQYTNFILCGGKDSLNGLLLRWRNPVVVLSGEPNYSLVRDFINANDLPFDLVRLEGYIDKTLIDREVAENFCRLDLQHVRWTPQLIDLAEEASHRAIFWNGAIADTYLQHRWMYYSLNRSVLSRTFREFLVRIGRNSRGVRKIAWEFFRRRDVQRFLWERVAAWQGANLGLMRSMTGCITLSFYFGPETLRVLNSCNFPEFCVKDIRPEVGRYLAGRDIIYPATNPSPPQFEAKAGLSSVQRFVDSLRVLGIPVTD